MMGIGWLGRSLRHGRGLLLGVAGLAGALGMNATSDPAQAQAAVANQDLAARIKAEFQAVKTSTAQVQQEAPRLDRALETLADQIKQRAELSAEAKAAAQARVEAARATLRRHGDTLRAAIARLDASDGIDEQDLAALAELMTLDGDRFAIVIADESLRPSANADAVTAAHAAYRKAVADLVAAARQAGETARQARAQGDGGGEVRGGKGDRQQTGR